MSDIERIGTLLPAESWRKPQASHLLKFERELIHCSAARRLDREVTGILRMAPEIAFGDKLESGRLDFAAQRALLDAMQGLADRDAVAGLCGMVGDDKQPTRLERGVQLAVHLRAIDTHVCRVVVEKEKCDEVQVAHVRGHRIVERPNQADDILPRWRF